MNEQHPKAYFWPNTGKILDIYLLSNHLGSLVRRAENGCRGLFLSGYN